MVQLTDLPLPDEPRLAANITHFARALRRAGLPIGPGHVIDAVRAVSAAGFTRRDDFYWTLHAVFTSSPRHHATFDQLFRLYWRDPRFLEHMMAMLLPSVRGTQDPRVAQPAERRAAEALLDGHDPGETTDQTDDPLTEIEIDAARTASARERLRQLDFEQMSAAELAEAQRILAGMDLPVPLLLTRRRRPGTGGRPDPRRTLRQMVRRGGEIARIETTQRQMRPPTLVVICDISGSMSRYARTMLHFIHAASHRGGWQAVHAFTFGTRLTNITRHMATRDVDAALAAAGAEAQDWEGGTRIGACLHAFNRDWSRRVLSGGAVVLLVTDGLERDAESGLAAAAQRLGLSSRRLIWINPLLRYDGFAPRAAGIRALLPHVDAIVPGHSIDAMAGLAEAVGQAADHGHKDRLMDALRAGPDRAGRG